MTEATLEERVAKLEEQVATLLRGPTEEPPPAATDPPWLRAVHEFRDDEGLLEVFREALKLREEDRKKTCQKPARKQPGRS